jgi:hypothetical protein
MAADALETRNVGMKGQACEAKCNGEQDSGGDQPKFQELPTSHISMSQV